MTFLLLLLFPSPRYDAPRWYAFVVYAVDEFVEPDTELTQ